MTYSDVEISALKSSFPGVKVYLCDFHREQVWEQWIKDQAHIVDAKQTENLLENLRACAWAPPVEQHENLHFDHHYRVAVSKLKESNEWVDNPQVQGLLLGKWLLIHRYSHNIID